MKSRSAGARRRAYYYSVPAAPVRRPTLAERVVTFLKGLFR